MAKRLERVLFLCSKWGVGFGASKVVEEQARGLAARGYEVAIGCIDRDGSGSGEFQVLEIPGKMWGLRSFIERGDWDIVIAHTFPFMGLLPDVRGVLRVVVDLGEPTPSLMAPEERDWREALAREKAERVVPSVECVVTISESVRSELGWPAAEVIYIGVDHFVPVKNVGASKPTGKKRLLCISRMGRGEARYKGFENLVRLQVDLGDDWEVVLAGRGSDADAAPWRAQGLRVENSLGDEELADLVLGADALVSFSRWEGFNLPLAEWSHAGKPAYALALCAHPEVSPFVYGTYEELRDAVSRKSREDFAADGRVAQAFCCKFTWAENVARLDRLICSAARPAGNRRNPVVVSGVRAFWTAYGVARRLVRRIRAAKGR